MSCTTPETGSTHDAEAREKLWALIKDIRFSSKTAQAAVTGKPPIGMGEHGEVRMA